MPCSRARSTPSSGRHPPRHPRRGPAGRQRRGPGHLEVPTDQAGHGRLLRLASRRQGGGCGPWRGRAAIGGGLTWLLVDQGEGWTVIDRPCGPGAATGPRATPWTRSGRPRRPGPRPPHQPRPARAPRSPAGPARHPGRHRGRRRRRPPPAQGPDRHRPRAPGEPPGGRPWRQQLGACAELVAARRAGGAPRHRAGAGPDRPAGPGRPG